jgi:hypothetical protein
MIRCQKACNRPQETIMRGSTILTLAAGAAILGLGAIAPAVAGGGATNPDGVGIYAPLGPKNRHGPRAYRYDPRSWYYNPRGYYPYYGSGYWVPRAEMRYRYRYVYYGPQYRYYRAWGYGVPPVCCGR